VGLAAFEIAQVSVPLEEILGDPYDLSEDIDSIAALCEAIDAELKFSGLRLPTEDELEAACGGQLFWWGMRVPDGRPYHTETSFHLHHQPNALGLLLNDDPYNLEVARSAFKLGDGGAALCGESPWPVAWLTLAPSWRLGEADVADLFLEHLETARIRPVRLG
jgi:hypothetical protein